MIKHLLLVVAASATLFTANAEGPKVLWETNTVGGNTLCYWNGGINIPADSCSNFKAGDKIEVTIDKKTIKKEDGCFVNLSYGPEGKWTPLFIFALGDENPETASVTLLQSQVDIMKNHGFAPVGYNVNIHKIVYVPSDIEVHDNAIWIGPKDFKQWGQMDFPAFPFSNAKAGDKLMFKISEANGPYIQLIIGGWGGTEINNDSDPNKAKHPERFTITDSSITVTLTQEEVDKLKATGLVIQAAGYVLDQLLLVPENTIWVGPKSFKTFDGMQFSAALFSNAKKDYKLVFKISEANKPFIKLLFGGWGGTEINNDTNPNDYTHPERFTITENSITVTLTQEEVDKLKATGLVIQAAGYVLDQLQLVPDNPTGTTNLVIDNNDCAVEYYNLQGVRVSNPENGIFIRRQGDKTIKVIK